MQALCLLKCFVFPGNWKISIPRLINQLAILLVNLLASFGSWGKFPSEFYLVLTRIVYFAKTFARLNDDLL